jgi:hypothetical protein
MGQYLSGISSLRLARVAVKRSRIMPLSLSAMPFCWCCSVTVVVVYVFRPVEPKARLPKGLGRPAACLAYLN